jgi:hypothetical protein
MKTKLFLWVLTPVFFIPLLLSSQIGVSIKHMSYSNGATVANGDPIEVTLGQSVTINFEVHLSRSSGHSTGNGGSSLKIFKLNHNNINGWIADGLLCDQCWGNTYVKQYSLTISSVSLDNKNGKLYAEFEEFTGRKHKSSYWPINVVIPPISHNSISSNQTIDEDELPSTIYGSNPMGGNGSYSYKWEKFSSGNWVAVNGATSKNYTPGMLSQTTRFRRKVTSSPYTNTSNEIVVTVIPLPQISNNTISFNGVNLLTGSSPSGGNSTYTYKWFVYVPSANADPAPLPNATGKHFVLPPHLLAAANNLNLQFSREVVSFNKSSFSNWISVNSSVANKSTHGPKQPFRGFAYKETDKPFLNSYNLSNLDSLYNKMGNSLLIEKDEGVGLDYTFFPNPSNETIILKTNFSKNTNVRLYFFSLSNNEKHLVLKQVVSKGKKEVRVLIPESIPHGLYFYELLLEGESYLGKLIKS